MSVLPSLAHHARCYWALLDHNLRFVYLDPILQRHLDTQAHALLAKPLLDFVHPAELHSAKNDLGAVRTLHGSVTRVRFSRLSRVRRLLGYDGPCDSDYMPVDIVINCAAEGLVLCFIHPIDPCSNWCGTPLMDPKQIDECYARLCAAVPTAPTNRVFQILDNRDGRPLLLSWPPDQGQGTQHPNARDFALLVENAQIGTQEAKTSCTRRYKALQSMPSVPQVESIYIPHGSVIFACHKVDTSPLPRSSVSSIPTMQQQLGYTSPNSSYYPSVLPPLSASYPSYSYPPPDYQWGSGTPSPTHSVSSLPPVVSNLRAASYPPHQPPFAPGGPQGTPLFDLPRPASANQSYSPGPASDPSLPPDDIVPPSRKRTSPGADGYGNVIPGGRNVGNRPNGVFKCSSCKVTSSPEWRKGPSGKKELCNACGLRYARSRAKKEGHPPSQRRRKDKSTTVAGGITKREASATPPYASSSSAPVPGTYPHHALEETKAGMRLTPSPSPPMGFVHYAPGGAHHHGFYSVPSPLSHTIPLREASPVQGAETYSGYVARSTGPPASFERERERERERGERELPLPLPIGHGRRILAQHG